MTNPYAQNPNANNTSDRPAAPAPSPASTSAPSTAPSAAPKYGPQSATPPTPLAQQAQQAQHLAHQPQGQPMVPAQPKSMVAALILCFLFGGLGIHNFYLGQTSKGIWHLVLAVLTIIPVLGWIVLAFHICLVIAQFIMIATSTGSYGKALRGIR